MYFEGNSDPYILHPYNYFYIEDKEESSSDVDRICIALKGEEENKIIMGAFSMVDHFFYFDRVSKELIIYE